MNRILIAEDEPRIASFLDKGLRANGFSVTVVDDGEDALHMADSDDFDLLILDVGLPAMDGFAVLRELRRRGRRMPIVMLTARDSVDELLARVRVRLRTERVAEATVLAVGGASLDLRTRRLAVDGRTEELTAREFALAEMFFRHPGQVLSREQLLSNVWGYDYDPGSNVVEVYVRYLRQKIGEARITTVRGMGYRLEEGPRTT
jgi:two-component system copper resistance phosphate regulon response regulator CusR